MCGWLIAEIFAIQMYIQNKHAKRTAFRVTTLSVQFYFEGLELYQFTTFNGDKKKLTKNADAFYEFAQYVYCNAKIHRISS